MGNVRIRTLTLFEVEHLAHALAAKLMKWDEPIPSFGTRFPNILESCLATPFMRFERRPAHRGLLGKGAMLFYLMIKNHPFQNGNKRIAVTALLVFLAKNGKWLNITNHDLYLMAKWVAESPPNVRIETVAAIHRILEHNLTDVPKEIIG